MKGPYVILDTLHGTWYDATGTGRGDRRFWVVRQSEATEYRTLALAEQALADKFSKLTRGDLAIRPKDVPPIPTKQRVMPLADLARRFA